MFIVPFIQNLNGTFPLFASIGVILYAVQIVMVFVLIYRVCSFIVEWIEYRQEFKEDFRDQELYLDEQINEGEQNELRRIK